jgi:hypothetical protein
VAFFHTRGSRIFGSIFFLRILERALSISVWPKAAVDVSQS